jgi:hypothetical protein
MNKEELYIAGGLVLAWALFYPIAQPGFLPLANGGSPQPFLAWLLALITQQSVQPPNGASPPSGNASPPTSATGSPSADGTASYGTVVNGPAGNVTSQTIQVDENGDPISP